MLHFDDAKTKKNQTNTLGLLCCLFEGNFPGGVDLDETAGGCRNHGKLARFLRFGRNWKLFPAAENNRG